MASKKAPTMRVRDPRTGRYRTVYAVSGRPAPAARPAAARNKAYVPKALRPAPPLIANAAPTPAITAALARPKNHFGFVLDCSGSMGVHRAAATRLYNEQLALLRRSDQDNVVTEFEFGHHTADVREVRYSCPIAQVPDRTSWVASGSTPLYDAVRDAVGRMSVDGDPDRAFVLLVLTDGQENASRRTTSADLQWIVADAQATDRWTLVFLVPPGYKSAFVSQSGVPAGNVREWADLDRASAELVVGTQSYLALRKRGGTSTRGYFRADLAAATAADLLRLHDVTDEVSVWRVDREQPILEFVNRRSRGRFAPGRAFYEVMKREDNLQDYKKLLLQDRATGRVYADGPAHTVRALCGLPDVGDVRLEPGNHANFVLYAQSTSTNRVLPRGTKVAYWSTL